MNRILSYLIIGILIPWLFLSCAKDDDVLVGGEDNPITVSFVLSTQNVLTRAENDIDWGDDYDKVSGDNFENQINSVALIVFNNEGNMVASIDDFQYFAATGTASDGCAESYLVVAEITKPIGETGKYRFVVVANATLKKDDVDNSTYSISDINTTGIPMWGVVTKLVSTNSNVDLGTIHLLRAVAKIELKLASTTKTSQFTINKATITTVNSQGYVFPAAKTVESTLNLNHANQSFNPFNESALSSDLVFTTASDGKSSYIYITEWQTRATNNAKIALQISDGSKFYPFEIELKDYVTGDYHNIVRNHHYQYTITSVNIGAMLDLDCNVLDWEEDLEEWVYSDVPMVSDDGHISWEVGNENGNRVNLTPSAPYATFTFGLEAPVGASWYAEFVTIKGKQKAFKFTQGNNASITDGSFATGTIGKFVSLTISTTGSADVENNEAYLRIYVILPDGRTIRVSSMLHKDENSEYVIVQTP